jgi:DNA (cytosine-5)-methyltransferase 1
MYGSVCSGIEAATVAWHQLGWIPAFFSEIEAFPRALLAERWPGVPIHGDFTTIGEGDYEPIELLVGGTPCQDFSVAGLRAGLVGDRGGLTIEFVHLARRLRPRWLVWENVPGILSIDDGRAFGAFLALLGQCGYGFAYRILDAQHFGVPQRRRRVFVVGYLGDWRPAAAVLFEPESLRGDSAPRRETGERIAAKSLCGTDGGIDREDRHTLIAFHGTQDPDISGEIAHPLGRNQGQETALAFGGNNTAGPLNVATACNAHGGPHGWLDFASETFVTHSLRADGFDASEDGTGRGTPPTLAIRGRDDSYDLEYRDDGIANAILTPNGGRGGIGCGAIAETLRQHPRPGSNSLGQLAGMTIRRLTPGECERLQGFPDNYTAITYRGKPAADGPRYRALGNSMAVPCMRWIGDRINEISKLECLIEHDPRDGTFGDVSLPQVKHCRTFAMPEWLAKDKGLI